MKSQEFKKISKDIPEVPGVYFFMSGADILYIGKATSLRDRVRSYFTIDLLESRGPKIVKMLDLCDGITWQETDSVLEALILESNLIKKNQPPYNTREKDNKSYNYVVITKEDMPRVFTVRERELLKRYVSHPSPLRGAPLKGEQARKVLPFKIKHTFGPFPNGNVLREALKILRKIFPFRDKKSTQKAQERFYQMLGLAPDASSAATQEEYSKTIKNLKLFFDGKKATVIKNLERDMKKLSKELRFEEAEIIKRRIFALQHIRDIALIKDIESPFSTDSKNFRIEAYDVAHLAGTNTVGVMTVVENGEIDKNEYRKFKIKNDRKGSDTHALREMLERRLAHPEWSMPNLIVADGGTAQKRLIESVLRETGNQIPVVSVAKDERHKPRELRGQGKLIETYQKQILLANAEAHRFAIEYHKKKRRGSLL